MSIVNLGLQCVGMMRTKQLDAYEEKVGMYLNYRYVHNCMIDFKLLITQIYHI